MWNSFILNNLTQSLINLKTFIGSAVLLSFIAVAHVQAAPIIFYDGTVQYSATTQDLTVNATVTSVDTAAVSSDVLGSVLTFSANLDGVADAGFFTNASFSTDPSAFSLDGADNYITGGIQNLTMSGVNYTNTGSLQGTIDLIAGTLLSDFESQAQLFAIELDLTNFISLNMFDSDFSGVLDGQIDATPVPESVSLVLLTAIFAGLLIGRRKKLKFPYFGNFEGVK